MAKRQARKSGNKRPIEQYEHPDKKRPNNPPVGLVTPETDRDSGKKTYLYDPHLDPQLVWAGKAERTSFEVPTVSLHVHERIDPRTIIEAVRKRNGNGNGGTLTPALSQRERERGTLSPALSQREREQERSAPYYLSAPNMLPWSSGKSPWPWKKRKP